MAAISAMVVRARLQADLGALGENAFNLAGRVAAKMDDLWLEGALVLSSNKLRNWVVAQQQGHVVPGRPADEIENTLAALSLIRSTSSSTKTIGLAGVFELLHSSSRLQPLAADPVRRPGS